MSDERLRELERTDRRRYRHELVRLGRASEAGIEVGDVVFFYSDPQVPTDETTWPDGTRVVIVAIQSQSFTQGWPWRDLKPFPLARVLQIARPERGKDGRWNYCFPCTLLHVRLAEPNAAREVADAVWVESHASDPRSTPYHSEVSCESAERVLADAITGLRLEGKMILLDARGLLFRVWDSNLAGGALSDERISQALRLRPVTLPSLPPVVADYDHDDPRGSARDQNNRHRHAERTRQNVRRRPPRRI